MKKIILLSMCVGLSFQVVYSQDKTTGSSTSGSSASTSTTDVKAKVESLYQQAYSKYKAGSFDAALSMISEAEGLLKAQNTTDVRFAKLRDEIYAAQKAKSSTATGGNTTGSTTGSTTAGGTASGVDTKYKLDAMYQEAASKLKGGNPDAALQIIYNAEAIMKNTGVTDPRFAKLKEEAVAMQKSKNNGTTGTTGSTGTTGNSGKTGSTDGKTTGSTDGKTTNTTDVKAKVESLYQQAYSKYKAGSFDAALSMISEAEGLLKAQKTTDVRFAKLRDEIYAAQKAKTNTNTTTGDGKGSTTGSTTAGGTASGVDTKYKLDAMYQEAASKLKGGNPDAALQIIYNAEAIMKNTGVTDPRFAKLKEEAVAMQKSKNNGTTGSTGTSGNSGKTGSTDGKTTGSTDGKTGSTTSTDAKSKLDTYYNDAFKLYQNKKYVDALSIIATAEQLMKTSGITDKRFSDLKAVIEKEK